MGSRSGFDADGDLGALRQVVDNGSGAISVSQRVANVLVNLGLAAGTTSDPVNGVPANGTALTPGTSQNSSALVTNSSGNLTFVGTLTVSGTLNITGTNTQTGLVLSAGTATVAPLTITAGTNLTSVTAGAVEFDGNAFYMTAIASARQQVDAEQYIIASANSAVYNNTGLDTNAAAAVFTATTNPALTNGAISLAAGKTYAFEFQYILTNTGTTSHTWAVALGGTATFSAGSSYSATGVSGTTASTPASGSLTGFISSTTLSTAVVVTAASTSATEQVTVAGMGILVIANAGTVIPQMKASARPGASGTPGVTILAGSFFRIWEMGTNTQVGNWS